MDIKSRLQDISAVFSERVRFSDESIDRIFQRILYETEQIRLPTNLLKETIAQITDKAIIGRYAMSGQNLDPDIGDSTVLFSDYWIDSLVNNRQAMLADNLYEQLERLARHKNGLSVWLGTPINNILNIEISDSETHNNGRSLVIYTVDDGSKVVYKPVCLRVVKLFGEIVQDVLGRDNDIVKVPQCYPAGEDYGFLEYLEKAKIVTGDKALHRFYYRSGVLLSLAYGLRITDLHDGNMIASGEFPVIFDLETSFYQFPSDLDFTDVRDTGMIGNKASSAIEGGGNSWEWQPRVETTAHGQPLLRYTKKVWFDDNRLYDGSELADPYRYAEDVITGFQYGYRAILESRGKIMDRIEQAHQERRMRVRHLVRHTAYYNLLLAWLRQPMVDSGTSRQEEILEDLYNNYKMDHPLSEPVYTAERDDLLRGDIPYFWTSFDSYDLEHISGIVQKGYFKETSYQVARRHLDRMSVSDMDNQVQIIRESMRGPHA